MVLSLFSGCAPAADSGETTAVAKEHVLRVGYGRVDISPDYPVPIAGTAEERIATEVREPIYATCIAFTDETDNTILLYQLDLLDSSGTVNMARRQISQETGVSAMQIFMAATHNHYGPALDKTDNPSIERYNEELVPLLVQAAVEAMADRKPAKMHIARSYPEGVNFTRHVILADGTRYGRASDEKAQKEAVAHLLDPDNQLQLIKFTREGGKDVILMNWQGHASSMPNGKWDTADLYVIRSYYDHIRRAVEAKSDCLFGFFLGASGQVVSSSVVPSIKKAEGYLATDAAKANALAQHTANPSEAFREVKTGPIRILETKHAATSLNGSNTIDIQLFAFSFGDVAFTTAPYEMFLQQGIDIKEQSPYEMTFVSTCTGGSVGYLPSDYAFDLENCYETSGTKFARGTAEAVAQTHITLLKQLYETK